MDLFSLSGLCVCEFTRVCPVNTLIATPVDNHELYICGVDHSSVSDHCVIYLVLLCMSSSLLIAVQCCPERFCATGWYSLMKSEELLRLLFTVLVSINFYLLLDLLPDSNMMDALCVSHMASHTVCIRLKSRVTADTESGRERPKMCPLLNYLQISWEKCWLTAKH